MEKIDFETLKTNVSAKLQKLSNQSPQTTESNVGLERNFNSLVWILFIFVAVAGAATIVFLLIPQKDGIMFVVATLFIGVFILLMVLFLDLEQNSENQYFIANANKLLLDYFANVIPHKDDYDRQKLITENLFITYNKPINLIEKPNFFAGVAAFANLRTSFLEYQKGLLIRFPVRDSMDNNLYFVGKNVNTDFLNLPKVQIFSYFDNINQAYKIYSDFRGESAAFIAQNQSIFMQIAGLFDKHVVFGFLGDSIYLYYRNFEMSVLTNHHQYVDLDSPSFRLSFYQLQQIYKILHLLAKVK